MDNMDKMDLHATKNVMGYLIALSIVDQLQLPWSRPVKKSKGCQQQVQTHIYRVQNEEVVLVI